jgi:hypothetical protein
MGKFDGKGIGIGQKQTEKGKETAANRHVRTGERFGQCVVGRRVAIEEEKRGESVGDQSRKKEEEKGKKSVKSKEKEEADAHKKLHSMKKKSAEKAKLKAAAKRV